MMMFALAYFDHVLLDLIIQGREDGDVERPETSVPFLEVDQYIEPSAGKHPSLMDPDFPTFGALKVPWVLFLLIDVM